MIFLNTKLIPFDAFCSRLIYPGMLALLISTLTFPLGTGQFLGGDLSTESQLTQLFSNFTWTSEELNEKQANIVAHWSTKYTSIFGNLTCYSLFHVGRPPYSHTDNPTN